jgi:hypothetical protein
MTERVLGPTGGRRRKRALLLAPLAVLALMLVLAVGASGQKLPGSAFEIDDVTLAADGANLVVDTAGGKDWANVDQIAATDLATGTTDDSYQGGVKEDTVCPGTTTGSIPNNKSDLLKFGSYFESEVGGPGWLHVYWQRVQEPNGTTNMDFEFNRSTTDCDGTGPSKNVVRAAGDVLLQFDIDQGGAQAKLSRRTWLASGQWSDATVLSASEAIGSINQVAISAANADNLGAMSARTFGEASFDLSAVVGSDPCLSFGTATLKSRSSDSFTSQLKDFIAPIPINTNNCGAIKVTKTRKHAADGAGDHPQSGVTFTVNGVSKVTGTDGTACFDGLALNQQYSVVETLPAGYAADEVDLTKEVTPDNSASCTATTYVGENVSFRNTPLTNVGITAHSQVTGGTRTSVDCSVNALDTALSGDVNASASNLQPQTITCTIVIDP